MNGAIDQVVVATLGLTTFVVFLAVHVLVFRCLAPDHRFRVLMGLALLGYGAAAAGIIGLAAWAGPQWAGRIASHWLSVFLVYSLFLLAYFNFYALADRSITTRMLFLVRMSPTRSLSYAELKALYPLDDILYRRCQELVYGGYMRCDGGRYENRVKGDLWAMVLVGWSRLLGIGAARPASRQPGGAR